MVARSGICEQCGGNQPAVVGIVGRVDGWSDPAGSPARLLVE